VVDAFASGRQHEAADLFFEYMAATEEEAGRGQVDRQDQLPPPLRAEVADLRSSYPPPGAVFIAIRDDRPIGSVGVKFRGRRAEVRRLWVRPSARAAGVGRLLMDAVHQHAEQNHVSELVLDVMASRSRAIDLYLKMGYAEMGSTVVAGSPMVLMSRKSIGS